MQVSKRGSLVTGCSISRIPPASWSFVPICETRPCTIQIRHTNYWQGCPSVNCSCYLNLVPWNMQASELGKYFGGFLHFGNLVPIPAFLIGAAFFSAAQMYCHHNPSHESDP